MNWAKIDLNWFENEINEFVALFTSISKSLNKK